MKVISVWSFSEIYSIFGLILILNSSEELSHYIKYLDQKPPQLYPVPFFSSKRLRNVIESQHE